VYNKSTIVLVCENKMNHYRTISHVYFLYGRKLDRKAFETAVVEAGFFKSDEEKSIGDLFVCVQFVDHMLLQYAYHMWVHEMCEAMKYPSIFRAICEQLNPYYGYSRTCPKTLKEFTLQEVSDAFRIISESGLTPGLPLNQVMRIALDSAVNMELLQIEKREKKDRLIIMKEQTDELLDIMVDIIERSIIIQNGMISNFFLMPVKCENQRNYAEVCRRLNEVLGKVDPPLVEDSEHKFCEERGFVMVLKAENIGWSKRFMDTNKIMSNYKKAIGNRGTCNICDEYAGTHGCTNKTCAGEMCEPCYNTILFNGLCPFCKEGV
jgi:hypothetical protein